MTNLYFNFGIPFVILIWIPLTVPYDSPAKIAGISSSCQEASEILLASDLGCANLKDLQPILSSNLSSNVLPPFIAWVEEICPTSPCSDSVINTGVKILEKGCASELTIGTSAVVVLSGVIENYLPLRRMVCEQYKSNGSYCVTSLLTTIGQNLTITTLKTILIDGFSSLVPFLTSVHKFSVCNECGHFLYNDAMTMKSQKDSETINSSKASEREKILTEICGSSFLDGKVPTTIQPAPITHHSTSSTVPANSSTLRIPLSKPRKNFDIGDMHRKVKPTYTTQCVSEFLPLAYVLPSGHQDTGRFGNVDDPIQLTPPPPSPFPNTSLQRSQTDT
ncbi:hypothetical protein CROQUDRAFT_109335 [Cronartium quercuum f. sp. fusiforme G11]|uniref:SPARK domain-containing protein n=1 Tax=Cronartium quercuum f. sp. fusiforme G11 TaxID=708437 RepID=A0A9P6NCV6_9BASI|nr:hypothetical protein CROQUDRAFT_109335 [Cronartium quercuum f. sp. fusiforme G11]